MRKLHIPPKRGRYIIWQIPPWSPSRRLAKGGRTSILESLLMVSSQKAYFAGYQSRHHLVSCRNSQQYMLHCIYVVYGMRLTKSCSGMEMAARLGRAPPLK